MSNLKVKDADSGDKFISGSGAGTDLDPIILDRNLVSIADGIQSAEKSYSLSVIGTSDTPVLVAASGSANSLWQNVSKLSKQRSLLVDLTAGTGTYKVECYIALDSAGIIKSELISLATGLTASKIIDIPLVIVPYGHYLQVIITETGGANSVTIHAVLMGRGAS